MARAMSKKSTNKAAAAGDDTGRRPELRAKPVSPMSMIGAGGSVVYGGYLQTAEKDQRLRGSEKYRTYGEILANITIVAAGVRFFLNLVSAAQWRCEAKEDAGEAGEEMAERVQEILEGMDTSLHRIVRKAAMYRFYGFSILEWVARREEDGTIVFADCAVRPQSTVERWDLDTDGKVLAVLQRNPQTQVEVAIPREKLVYLVDDSLSDTPEGMGLFRHIVKATARLERYEQLEGFGYEGDLRGIPIVRAPIAELQRLVEAKLIDEAGMKAMLQPLSDFITNHIKSPTLGVMIDSSTYRSDDAAASPSSTPQWDVSLLDGGDYSLEEVAAAITRVTMEIARVLGVEHLLLGSDGSGTGSYALSKDKSNNFGLIVDSTLKELREQFTKDLLKPLFALNGWNEELMPKLVTDTTATRDIEQLSTVIRDLSAAGVVLDREDEAVGELFNLLGLPKLVGQLMTDPDAQLGTGNPNDPNAQPGEGDDEDELPVRESRTGTEE